MAESSRTSAKACPDDEWAYEYAPEGGDISTEIADFSSECPCCGTVITFRLKCTATADETEIDR